MKKLSKRESHEYFKEIILPLLNLKCNVEKHHDYSFNFTYNLEGFILFPGANKIQVKTTAKWLDNAANFIIDEILKDETVLRIGNYTPPVFKKSSFVKKPKSKKKKKFNKKP